MFLKSDYALMEHNERNRERLLLELAEEVREEAKEYTLPTQGPYVFRSEREAQRLEQQAALAAQEAAYWASLIPTEGVVDEVSARTAQ